MTHPISRYLANNPAETWATLAQRSGLSRMTLWRMANGVGEFSTETLRKVSKATGGVITVGQLADAAGTAPRRKRKSKPTKPAEGKEPTAA